MMRLALFFSHSAISMDHFYSSSVLEKSSSQSAHKYEVGGRGGVQGEGRELEVMHQKSFTIDCVERHFVFVSLKCSIFLG